LSPPIESYGFIGNMVSGALVGLDGSIDWLCLPRFDSDACFAALLGTPEHGRWLIAPEAPVKRTRRRYRPGTAILETTFETEEGEVQVIDFMPRSDDAQHVDLIRVVRGLRGRVQMRTELVVRFGYGKVVPWVRSRDHGISAIAGPDAIELHTPVELHGEDFTTVGRFSVGEGASVPFMLDYHPSHRPAAQPCLCWQPRHRVNSSRRTSASSLATVSSCCCWSITSCRWSISRCDSVAARRSTPLARKVWLM
jgi:GH15 family glucan-1,4-alpha-glucosidase